MSVPSKFLTLSIKEQLFITILLLTIFSVIVILCLPGSFSYEILMEDYKKKKKFFFLEYKEYIQACFYFQSFTMLKYEEIIKRMAKQIYKYSRRENIFETESDFKDSYSENYPVQDLLYNNENDNNILYKYCFNTDENCELYKDKLLEKLQNKYESLNGLIFSHDIGERFRIPGYRLPIINSFFSVNVNDSVMFGFGKDSLHKALLEPDDYNNINKNDLKIYYKSSLSKMLIYSMNNILSYLNLDLFLFEKLFSKIINEMNEIEEINYFKKYPRDIARALYVKAVMGYYSTIELGNDKCYLFTYKEEDDKYYYYEFNLINNILEEIHNILSNELNMDFIPFYAFNHTIMSPELCMKFLMRQSYDIYNEKTLNDFYNNIHKGKSGIDKCFYDKKILDQSKIREMFETNITHFLTVSNIIYQGLIELNEPYFFMRYSLPNLNTLKEFVSDYFLLDQIDIYLFASFKEPIEYSNYIKKQYQNLFYLIIILILYIWVICFIVNMIIYCKVAKQITDPIYKLQEAIENNNLKDENVFKYEYDDIINELFITCKELLTGQIDSNNNLKYGGQFNILNNQKDKDNVIDKNKYEKNLIINNDIVNQLINEQQNMMNFGKEIDINGDLNTNDTDFENEERNAFRKNSNLSRTKLTRINETENKDESDIIKLNKMQEEEDDKDKRSYKSLFKLAQYLYYYRCKVEENNINININQNIDEKKSNVSKTKNQSSMRNERNHKKSLSRSGANEKNDDNNITVNVLKGKDLTYLWYMEMKKKNNRSFNYEISDDYEELFMDYYTNKNL